jgi:hypothetical protein
LTQVVENEPLRTKASVLHIGAVIVLRLTIRVSNAPADQRKPDAGACQTRLYTSQGINAGVIQALRLQDFISLRPFASDDHACRA